MKPGRLVRKGPVRWLAPTVLLRTLFPVYFSGLFARFSDRREVEAVVPQKVVYTAPGDELWVDYVVDTADGFNATATVASLLAPEMLAVDGHVTRAGALLVLGGDEVYPVASMREYEDRFIGPFQAALPHVEPGRTMVALPGNHDWYDGLTAFLQVFCSCQWIGGWKTVQRRSYFACQLPNGWWLWAIDIQFDTYIDQPQLEYFKAMADLVGGGDAIILCWAKPSWLEADPASSAEARDQGWADAQKVRRGFETLDWFERTIVPKHAKVRLSLTGDAHHYARYESDDGEHKITAGLGGAFVSATHHLTPTLTKRTWRDGARVATEFRRRAVYPSCEESRSMRWPVLARIYANRGFAAIPAAAYAGLASWPTRPLLGVGSAALVVGALVGFSKPGQPRRAWPGLLHGGVQVAAGLGLAWVVGRRTGNPLLVAGGTALLGAAVGPLLFALYLLADDHALKLNTNELFAAQAIDSHKGFLRLHFRPDGDLDLYPVRAASVTSWVEEPDADGRCRLRPSTPPEVALIEERITVKRTPRGAPSR